jgi:predicted transcriptional regulator
MTDISSRERRRDRHEIIMEILKNAKDSIKKTHLMFRSRLSFAQLDRYLNALEKAGFITKRSGTWKTTKKGLEVIEFCDLCCRLVKEIP